MAAAVAAASGPSVKVAKSQKAALAAPAAPPGSMMPPRLATTPARAEAKALVTKRIRPLMCDGKAVHVVGIPLHWGFMGSAKKGWGPNSLTPFVGDANVDTPEFKAFLVNLEPTTPPGVAS